MKANIHVTNRTTAQKLTIHCSQKKAIELIASHVYSMYFKRLSYIKKLILIVLRLSLSSQHASARK